MGSDPVLPNGENVYNNHPTVTELVLDTARPTPCAAGYEEDLYLS